jgi:hypothetical protein
MIEPELLLLPGTWSEHPCETGKAYQGPVDGRIEPSPANTTDR